MGDDIAVSVSVTGGCRTRLLLPGSRGVFVGLARRVDSGTAMRRKRNVRNPKLEIGVALCQVCPRLFALQLRGSRPSKRERDH